MIFMKFYRNSEKELYGFQMEGHAGFGEEGADIVCSAVSVLVLNTVNCIEKFTDSAFLVEAEEEEGGYLRFTLTDLQKDTENKDKHHDAMLLLKAMFSGLMDIAEQYRGSIDLIDEEV